MKKILTALVFGFALVFGNVALAQPGGNAPAGNGDGDPNVCEELKKCPKEEPKPAPPPQYRCGEGTVEEGQTLVGKMCTCARKGTFPVPDLSRYGTIRCGVGTELLDEFDALVNKVNVHGQSIEELKKGQGQLLIFKASIEALNLPLFIDMVNREIGKIKDRLDALEKRVDKVEQRQDATDKTVHAMARSALQLTIGLEGGGNYRTASGEDENGTGKFSAGAGCVLGTVGLQGYFSDIFGLETQFKAGLMSGAHTDGAAGELGGTIGIALRFDPVYLALGPAWYTMVAAHHSDAGGEGNFRGWGMGGQLDVGVRPIPQLELGGTIFAGGGHNGSSEIRVEGAGAWIQGGVFLKGVLGVVDSEDSSK